MLVIWCLLCWCLLFTWFGSCFGDVLCVCVLFCLTFRLFGFAIIGCGIGCLLDLLVWIVLLLAVCYIHVYLTTVGLFVLLVTDVSVLLV